MELPQQGAASVRSARTDRPTEELPRALRAKLAATRTALVAERLTQALWLPFTLLLAALALALLDLPALLPGWLHLALLVLLGAAFLWLLWRGLRRLAWPRALEARERVERDSGLPHRPLTATLDRLPPGKDRQAARLFALHQARARAQLARLRASGPRPVVAGADPRGLGAAAALLLLVGLAVAGPDWGRRLEAAVLPRLDGSAGAPPATLDAWLDPPDYTGQAPIFLSAADPAQAPGEGVLQVPSGSRLLAQVQGGAGQPALLVDESETAFGEASPGVWKLEQELAAGQQVTIRQGDETLGSWLIEVVPDAAPTVAFGEPPGETQRQALSLSYEAADDYGLVDVKAEIRRADEPGLPPLTLDLADIKGTRTEASGQSFKDLTAHLWAGFAVELTLVATDELGQEGSSETLRIVLPEREFQHPVARQLVELRRRLTVSPDERLPIVRVLEALLEYPADYQHDSVVALAMSTAAGRLLHERADSAVAEVQEILWLTALRLEDGDVSLMAQSLRDIQERLREALENGASEEEIQALIDELEAAMEQYLEALAEEMMRQMEQGAEFQPMPEGSQMLESQDLKRMLDQMRELSQSGARDKAEQLLDQLSRMMENLQANPMAMMPSEQMQQALDQMRKMEDMLRQQQELLDESHRQAQEQAEQSWNQPQTGSPNPGDQPMEGQAQQQEELRRQLGEMMRDLANQMGDIPENLGRAEQSMREATGELQEGDAEGAIGPQTDAIDQLQQGLSEMAQQFAEQFGPAPGTGQGQTGVRPGGSLDPLGRRSGDGATDAVDRIDIPSAGELGRSREILEELRRRRGDPDRPQLEQDYIDRLLEQF